METTADTAVPASTAGDVSTTDSAPAPSTGVDYSKQTDDDILGAPDGDEGATGEAPADDTSAKPAPVEAKSVKPVKEELKPEDPEAPINEVIEPEELKALFKQHPSLRDSYYREQAYREVYPTVAEARAVKEFFPTADLAKQASEQQALLLDIDRLYTTEPAQFASKLIQGNPGAFKSFMEEMRPILYGMSPAAYREIVAEPAVRDVVENFKVISVQKGDEELAAALEIIEERLGYNVKAREREIADRDPRIQSAERAREEGQQRAAENFNAFSEGVNRTYWDGLQKAVTDAIGKPDAMSEKAVEMVAREVMEEVADALKARTDLKRIFDSQKRNGNYGPEHQANVAEFVLKYARQIVPAKAKARLTAWTNEILRVNATELKKKTDAPIKKDIGAGSGATAPKASSKKVDYRKTSDDDILNS